MISTITTSGGNNKQTNTKSRKIETWCSKNVNFIFEPHHYHQNIILAKRVNAKYVVFYDESSLAKFSIFEVETS